MGDIVLMLSRRHRVLRYDAVRATLVPLAQVGADGLAAAAVDAHL